MTDTLATIFFIILVWSSLTAGNLRTELRETTATKGGLRAYCETLPNYSEVEALKVQYEALDYLYYWED